MKNKRTKIILITLGILLIIGVGVLWLYLLVFNTNNEGTYTELPTPEGTNRPPTDTAPQEPRVDTAPVTSTGDRQVLRQLTTDPVAGSVFTDDGIRYVAKGTGHIFDIDFSSGIETQITNTTVPQTIKALFSPDAQTILLTAEHNNSHEHFIGTVRIGDSGIGSIVNGATLPTNINNLEFDTDNTTLYYTLAEEQGLDGYQYLIADARPHRLFSLPLTDMRILWGDTIYAYTIPSAYQIGYIYEVDDTNLKYVTPGRTGLMGMRFGDTLVTSFGADNTLYTQAHTATNSDITPWFLTLFPEKCVYDNTQSQPVAFCTVPRELHKEMYPDQWYKGLVSFSDSLWRIDITNNSFIRLANFQELSGRALDIYSIALSTSGQYLSLINKNDDTLWLFDIWLYEQQNIPQPPPNREG
ncbi:MAG: hypothetical protein LR017_02555 [Candidatus Pacebacteria bacterium]|nr:hypothetical protein [Candidatus Paceibacterota bacterium]